MPNTETPRTLSRLQEAYRAHFDAENGDSAGRQAARDYLNSSTAIYHDEVIGLGFLPKLYDEATLEYLDTLATTTYGILEKVTQRFLDDPAYRRLFEFSPTLERLINLPTGYQTAIPIMRMDLFLDEESLDFKFCEFNTDGTSAMNEDREGANALMRSATFARASQELALRPQELFEGWVDEFLALWESSEQAASLKQRSGETRPTIAIVDYTASATPYEFEEFRARFERRGLRCLISDVTQLEYRGAALYASEINPTHAAFGHPTRVDALYRRAVTGEILAELEADEPFIAECSTTDAAPAPGGLSASTGDNDTVKARGARALVYAVERRQVCMIGGFRTHVAHCKQLFTVLHLPETAAFLTREENAFIRHHVPYTTRLDNRHIDLHTVKSEKDRWIIKPEDGYGSQGVYAGVDQSVRQWRDLIDTWSEKHYIIQSYCTQYATPNIRLTEQEKHELEPFNILTGLYLYGGRFSGVFIRAGQKGIIVGFAGGITIPVFLANYTPTTRLALRIPEARTG
jgi:hypothetical protein